MKRTTAGQGGFTLIEMMIAIAIFGLVMGTVYGVYRAQMRTHYVQQQVVDMQQNIRAALYMMEREIKMAGLNPKGAAGIGISLADDHALAFSMDFTGGFCDGVDDDGDGETDEGCETDAATADNNGNGLYNELDEAEWYDGDSNDPDEQVVYALSNDGTDSDGDDIPDTGTNGINDGLYTESNDGGSCDLLRNGETLALNIDALNFVYLDKDGAVLATPVSAGDRSKIRTVQLTLVARSGAKPSVFFSDVTNSQSYQNVQGDTILPAQDDTFRRIAMNMEVTCRNIGL